MVNGKRVVRWRKENGPAGSQFDYWSVDGGEAFIVDPGKLRKKSARIDVYEKRIVHLANYARRERGWRTNGGQANLSA